MNELEQIISRLPTPKPSVEFDRSMSSFFASHGNRGDIRVERKPIWPLVVGCSLVSGLLGFVAGQTKSMDPNSKTVVVSQPGPLHGRLPSESRDFSSSNSVQDQLPSVNPAIDAEMNERLRQFVRTEPYESLLGGSLSRLSTGAVFEN